MYESYFRFRASPFKLTPDPRFFYANASHQEALATLTYGVERRKGIIVITGDAGTGKTTLLRRFVQNPRASTHLCYIVDPHLNFVELLRCVADSFGLAPSQDRLAMIRQLNEYAIEQFKKDCIVALLFDEAQDLSDEVLGELRLLSDWEYQGENLVQIVLAGPSELESRLAEPSFQQLKQRVALRSRLAPLGREEIGPYIQSRLLAAGHAGKSLFTTSAIERIAVHSKGIPRLVNVICDHALLIVCATSQREVAAETIEEVAGELQIDGPSCIGTEHPWNDLSRLGGSEVPVGQAISGAERDALAESQWVAESEKVSPSSGGRRAATARAAGPWRMRLMVYPAIAFCLGWMTLLFFRQERAVESAPASQPVELLKELIAPIPEWIRRALLTARPNEKSTKQDFGVNSPARDDRTVQNLEFRPPPGSQAMVKKNTPGTIEANKYRNREELESKFANRLRSEDTMRQTPSRQPTREEKKAMRVVNNSFVRDEPTSKAEIIATLLPGARVQVVGRRGDYWQIQSFQPNLVRGYVHQEDAFFEPWR